ncbi:hypothetical protein OJ998_02405 [Solirubrobacter taibaiensis]|nr:hypothetical protein [Solirubrobacter taibaiensis]
MIDADGRARYLDRLQNAPIRGVDIGHMEIEMLLDDELVLDRNPQSDESFWRSFFRFGDE